MAKATHNRESVKFNLAAIMKAAWANYREFSKTPFGWGAVPHKERFSYALQCAWIDAKRAVATEIEKAKANIEAQIAALDYAPFAVSVSKQRLSLQVQLAELREAA